MNREDEKIVGTCFFFMTSILRYAVIVLYLLIENLVQVKAHIFSFLVMFEKERIVE